jgi:hypothetical protein
MMKPEFLEGFPRENTATTCRYWVNYVVALAGLSLWEKKGMRESDMQEHILADYKKYCPIACEMYEEYMPIGFKESGALMRPVFGKACEEWTGVSLLRKFKEVVKRDIMNVYNPVFVRLFPNGKLPSGHQLKDAIVAFRQAIYEEEKKGAEKKKPMQDSSFPLHYLPFCAFGLFSGDPHPTFDIPNETSTVPLHAKGPSRDEMRELVIKEKSEITSTKTKIVKKEESSTGAKLIADAIKEMTENDRRMAEDAKRALEASKSSTSLAEKADNIFQSSIVFSHLLYCVLVEVISDFS